MNFSSIRAKILATTLPLLLLVMLLISGISYYNSSQIVENGVNREMNLQLTSTLNEFQAKFNKVKAIGETLARMAEKGGADMPKAQYRAILEDVLPTNDMVFGTGIWFEPYAYKADLKYFGPYVYKDNGKLVYTEEYEKPEYDYPNQDWYKNGNNTAQSAAFSEPFYDDGTKVTMFTGAFPFYDQNKKFRGISSLDMDLKSMQKMIADIKVGETGWAFLIDKNGTYISAKDSAKNMKVKIIDDSDTNLAAVGKEMLKNKQGTTSYSQGGEKYRLVYGQFAETGWILALVMPESELLAPLNSLLWRQIIITVIAIVLLSLVIIYVTKGVSQSFGRAVNQLDAMAEGDFSVEVPRETLQARDETGLLARAFDKSQRNVQTLLRQIINSVEQLAASSEEMTASAEQSSQAANQVASSISGLAVQTGEQIAAANDTADIIEKMSSNIRQMATTANGVAGQSAKASDKANEGNQAIEKAVEQMSAIDKSSHMVFESISKLNEQSKEIGQIVDAISGIAGQTNLLALNAAIEAARAGEQGRGFAVVAEEVRKLAEQSQEAAKQIADLINEIQVDTGKAVVAMENGEKEVKLGTEVVAQAGQSFREIKDLINQVSAQVSNMSVAIDQMADGSQQIVGAVNKMDNLCKTADEETQTISAATQEQSAAMEEIASASQTLSKLAMDLNDAVNKFHI